VTVLLDTHCWLWWIADPDRISAEARARIADPHTTILFSAASSWEIAIKCATGRLALPEPPEDFVIPRLARDGFLPLAVRHVHALRVAGLPPHHRDPFDRLLIAQAQVERVPIVTADHQFAAYDVELIWAT